MPIRRIIILLVIVLDENELKDALDRKDITKEDFDMAYKTLENVKNKYVANKDELINLTNNLYNELKNEESI